jgi:prepilin-type N-terminal cleavage/methylation domain-containing protein
MKRIPQNQSRRGMTLVELLVSLTVMTVLAVGSTNLILAGLKTDRVMIDSNRQVSEMELSFRRLTHNIRTGEILSLNGTTGITLTSQSDPNNNGQNYTIVYSYDAVAQTLSESSTQYGTTPPVNIIAYNVTAFSVSQVSSGPVVINIDMTIAGSNTAPPTRRVFRIMNRNS